MRRWWILTGIAAAGIAAAACYARFVERGRIELDRFTVALDRPGLPAEGLVILHISDLHCRAADPIQARKLACLSKRLAGQSYDLLMVTGDLITDRQGLAQALGFLSSLQPRLGAFFCPGNRDYWQSSFRALLPEPQPGAPRRRWRLALETLRRLYEYGDMVARNERTYLRVTRNDLAPMLAALQAAGIQPLVNAASRIRWHSSPIWVAGVDDLTGGKPDLAAALVDVPAGAPLILLAHNPDIWLEPNVERADLVLAGHTHGGQVCLPLLGAIYVQGTHLSRRRPAGWFQRGAARMFVVRGVGESFRWRFGAPPQAALIRLAPACP